jgi:hypothetical protein
MGEDSMISLGGHGENRGLNLMGNKCNICTFSRIKNASCIYAYDDKRKTMYGARHIFCISMKAPGKSLGTTARPK